MAAVDLWHYTCDHGLAGITADGFVKPNLNPVLTDAHSEIGRAHV